MGKLNDIARRLLQDRDVQVVIGYGKEFGSKICPIIASTNEETEKLFYDNRCIQNLSFYLNKKELICLGKPAIVSNIYTLRGIIRLAAEKQISNNCLIAIVFVSDEKIHTFHHLEEIEKYISKAPSPPENIFLEKLNIITSSERWNFWQKEMKNCIRCYACRQICPLCYCTQCTVEINQPQWIPIPSTQLGNTEWHIMRAMHLAGRCIECGSCGQVCPVHIPIHLLPIRLAKEIKELYNLISGMNQKEPCAMSTYKSDDMETFIIK